MEKSNLEKALEIIPIPNPGEKDIPEQYQTLRKVELAYEQLASAGQDVSDSLQERRYQIAELVANILYAEVSNIHHQLKNRSDDGLGVGNSKDIIIQCANKLELYLRKLYLKSYDSNIDRTELFPEP